MHAAPILVRGSAIFFQMRFARLNRRNPGGRAGRIHLKVTSVATSPIPFRALSALGPISRDGMSHEEERHGAAPIKLERY